MRDYAELIKSLRCDELICANDDCPYYDNDHVLPCQVEVLQGDAADAIEELLAEVKHLELETAANETDKQYLSEENRKLVDSLMNLRAPHWISVEDRLPEDSGYTIVFCADGDRRHVTFAKYLKTLKRWELSGARSYWRVLKWMPLPEPPKEDAE